MHPSRMIFAISDTVQCVEVQYDPENGPSKTEHKTLIPDLAVDDMVVVQTRSRHKMTIGKVTRLNIEPDLDSSQEMLWAYSKVDAAAIGDLHQQEDDAIETIKKLERMKKRRELRDEWMAGNGEELKALPIYSVQDKPKAK